QPVCQQRQRDDAEAPWIGHQRTPAADEERRQQRTADHAQSLAAGDQRNQLAEQRRRKQEYHRERPLRLRVVRSGQQGGCSRMVTVWREAVSQRPRLLDNWAEQDFACRNMKALKSGASATSPTAAIGYEVQASCYQA